MIQSISRQTLWSNLDGQSTTWFHPRACMVPDGRGGHVALMTLQSIRGSDYFGPVHESVSRDLGQTWSDPKPVPSLGRTPVAGHKGLQQGVCDVVPQYHPATNTVLALGHVVFYRGERFSSADQLARYPIYAIRHADGTWSDARKLAWDDPRGSFIYSNNCGQRVNLPGGDIQLAFTFGPQSQHRMVAGIRCAFDGQSLTIRRVGSPLKHPVKRGLLEPSVTRFGARFYLTIRAEDDRGYVCVSDDGLNWSDKKPWCWEDGTPLQMSTTQQHWLTHSEGLFLVYTRKDPSNLNVIRWRAPLFVARVNPENLRLIRDTERIAVPLEGDGIDEPDGVPLMGNFNVNPATEHESWVTVGSWLPRRDARGAVHLARFHWNRANTSGLFG